MKKSKKLCMLVLIGMMVCTISSISSQTISPSSTQSANDISRHFSISLIPDSIQRLIKGKSYKADCTIPMNDLRYIRCLHITAEGQTKEGEMIVNKKIARQVKEILYQLYINRHPTHRPLECRRRAIHESQQFISIQFQIYISHKKGV